MSTIIEKRPLFVCSLSSKIEGEFTIYIVAIDAARCANA